MLLYYITDRKSLSGSDAEQQSALLRTIAEAARAGIDYIQLREKDLSSRELERLAHAALRAVRENSGSTRLLVNARTDMALACGADGVHLPDGDISPSEVRALWNKHGRRSPIIGVSAHSAGDVGRAAAEGADFAVLAPIFEKPNTDAAAIGLEALREAVSLVERAIHTPAHFPVLALGGATVANARACVQAGASGVAGIRLFQTGDVRETVRSLQSL